MAFQKKNLYFCQILRLKNQCILIKSVYTDKISMSVRSVVVVVVAIVEVVVIVVVLVVVIVASKSASSKSNKRYKYKQL